MDVLSQTTDRLIALIGDVGDAHLLAVGKVLRAKRARVLWLDPVELARSGEDLTRRPDAEIPYAAFVRVPQSYGFGLDERPRSVAGLSRSLAPQSEVLRNLLSRWENAGTRVIHGQARTLPKEEILALPLLQKAGIFGSSLTTLDAASAPELVSEPLAVFVADGEVLAAFRYEGEERDSRSGAPRYTPLVLGTHLSSACERIVRLLRVRFAEVFAVRVGDSIEVSHVISGPDFLEPEAQTGVPLTEKLCDVLLADDVRVTLPPKIGPLKQQVEAFEASLIERALAESGGNQARAAATLGVPLRTLVYKIGKYQLRDRDLRAREQGL